MRSINGSCEEPRNCSVSRTFSAKRHDLGMIGAEDSAAPFAIRPAGRIRFCSRLAWTCASRSPRPRLFKQHFPAHDVAHRHQVLPEIFALEDGRLKRASRASLFHPLCFWAAISASLK